eukprot:g5096.t1
MDYSKKNVVSVKDVEDGVEKKKEEKEEDGVVVADDNVGPQTTVEEETGMETKTSKRKRALLEKENGESNNSNIYKSNLDGLVKKIAADESEDALNALKIRLEAAERKYEDLKRVRETNQEQALKAASEKMIKLEALHKKMKARLEEELKSTQNSLTKALRDLKRWKATDNNAMSSSSAAAAVPTAAASASCTGASHSKNFLSYLKTLTGIQIEQDTESDNKLHCTAICRPRKRGVKFIVSLPKVGEACQFIPRANTHLLPAHLREPLEIDVADAPSVISDVIGALWSE